jgi:hypothetical protein
MKWALFNLDEGKVDQDSQRQYAILNAYWWN